MTNDDKPIKPEAAHGESPEQESTTAPVQNTGGDSSREPDQQAPPEMAASSDSSAGSASPDDATEEIQPLSGEKRTSAQRPEPDQRPESGSKPSVPAAESTQKIPVAGPSQKPPVTVSSQNRQDAAPREALKGTDTEQPSPWALRRGPAIAIISALTLFIVVISAYVITLGPEHGVGVVDGSLELQELDPSEAMELKMFYPVTGKVALERRQVRKVTGVRDIATVVINEFLAGPSGGQGSNGSLDSYVPRGVEVLGVYLGEDRVLYMDFSSAMALNFQGDAVAEFLFLRALYRSLKENVYGVSRYRVLVDGAEVDTIGGHVFILHGLHEAVPYRLLEEDRVE